MSGSEGFISSLRSMLIGYGANAQGLHFTFGMHTTIDADDDVDTGLKSVVAAFACFESDIVAGATMVQTFVGDQAGTPVAGTIQIKTWEQDGTAATTFSKKVHWIAFGTPIDL